MAVFWMANFQTRRCIEVNQQDLQAHLNAIHHYPAFTIFCYFSSGSLARPTLQWCHSRHGYAVKGL